MFNNFLMTMIMQFYKKHNDAGQVTIQYGFTILGIVVSRVYDIKYLDFVNDVSCSLEFAYF